MKERIRFNIFYGQSYINTNRESPFLSLNFPPFPATALEEPGKWKREGREPQARKILQKSTVLLAFHQDWRQVEASSNIKARSEFQLLHRGGPKLLNSVCIDSKLLKDFSVSKSDQKNDRFYPRKWKNSPLEWWLTVEVAASWLCPMSLISLVVVLYNYRSISLLGYSDHLCKRLANYRHRPNLVCHLYLWRAAELCPPPNMTVGV